MVPEETTAQRGVFLSRRAARADKRGKAALIESIFAGGGTGPFFEERFS